MHTDNPFKVKVNFQPHAPDCDQFAFLKLLIDGLPGV
jgi:hypothetical protein